MYNNHYGEQFRKERKRLGLTQREVASCLGNVPATISFKENGEREFTAFDLYRVYICFGLDIGFGNIFDRIDNGELERFLPRFPKRIQEILSSKNYEKISIVILEEIKKMLEDTAMNQDSEDDTQNENERLQEILNKYQKKDGNLLRAIRLLEIAMQ